IFYFFFFFFFQAEDGIRDYKVTGVQTCALPIFLESGCASRTTAVDPGPGAARDRPEREAPGGAVRRHRDRGRIPHRERAEPDPRSEERRVGKEGRSRWSTWG